MRLTVPRRDGGDLAIDSSAFGFIAGRMTTRIAIAIAALLSAAPAWAADGTAVPEGSHLTLFALGLLGVIVGRRAAISAQRRQRAKDAETD